MKHYNIFFFLFFLLLIPLVSFAGSTHNVSGWAWSENIGWISLNSKNCDGNNDGLSDGTPSGCPAAGVAIGNYGVNIDPSTGLFTGYAWSEYAGWLSFESADVASCDSSFPPVAGCQGDLDFGTNKVTGWARFLAGSGGGWDGWVHLRGFASDVNATEYGAARNLSQLTGWAWGSDVVGWIELSGSTFQTQLGSEVSQGGTLTVEATNLDGTRYFGPLSVQINGPTTLTTTDAPRTVSVLPGSYTFTYVSGGPSGATLGSISPSSLEVGEGSNLSFTLLFTTPPLPPADPGGSPGPPTTSTVVGDTTFFCPSTTVRFAWIYSDPNSDPQAAFDLEVYNDSALTSLALATGLMPTSNQFYENTPGVLLYSRTYFWRVRVQDSDGAWSAWSATNSFTTPPTCVVADFSVISSRDIFVTIARDIVHESPRFISSAQAQVPERSTTSTITIVPTDFSSDVTLSVTSGLPPGGLAFFSPPVLTSVAYGTGSQFYVEVRKDTAAGVYNLTVQGTGGSPLLIRSTTVRLSVIVTDPRFQEF